VGSQVSVGEPGGQEAKDDQDAEQRLDTRVAEAQRSCALVIDDDGLADLVKRPLADVAVRADSLDVKQTSVGLEADLSQRGEVMQASADTEVAGVVDRGLGAQSPALPVVLLDPTVLIVDVDRRCDAFGDDPGAKPARGASVGPLVEDQGTWSGRPRSRFSRMMSSKNTRPVSGRSSTWVRENSACRIEMS